MAFLKVKNRAVSTLASGISDSDLSLTVATGEGALFPTTGDFHVTCEDEIAKCTSRTGDVLTVTRAQEGTAAAAHVSGKAVKLNITAAIIAELQAHPDLTTGVHGISILLFSAASKTYYIDSVSGDDGNGGEASDDAFETWGKAESMVPMFLLHSYTIRIIGDMAEDVDIRGRTISGSAILLIRGDTDTPGDHEVNKITLKAMLGDYRVQYLRATQLISMGACSSTDITSMYKLEPRCPAATADFAVFVVGGFVYFRDCDFGTDVVKDCIYIDGAHLVSRNNTGNGQRYGLHARGGGAIGKKDTQPTGTTGNELAADGGVIR